jgi:hypothetical protein
MAWVSPLRWSLGYMNRGPNAPIAAMMWSRPKIWYVVDKGRIANTAGTIAADRRAAPEPPGQDACLRR